MLIYIIVILLILAFQINLSGLKASVLRNKTENRYLKIICWVLVFLAALRGITVGTDTLGYWPEYLSLSSKSVSEVLSQNADFPGYYLLAKMCSLIRMPIQILFGIVEGLYVYAIYVFIKRYSSNKLFSILGFTVLDLYAFSLSGLKQVMAMSFVLFYFLALEDKKYIRAVVLAIAAFFCHQASLIFLFGVALYFMRDTKLFYVYLLLMVIITFFGSRFLWVGMINFLENDHYSSLYTSDQGYSNTTMIIYGVYVTVLFLFGGGYRKQSPQESRIMLGMSTLAFAFQAFSLVSSAAFRLSYFFLPFMIVAFPNVFNRIGDATIRQFVKTGTIIVLIFVFIYINRNGGSIVPYRFFWQ